MINYLHGEIQGVAGHYVGNSSKDEGMRFSSDLLDISDEQLYETLMKYFLSHFKEPEFYNFVGEDGSYGLNPIFKFVSAVFDDPTTLHEQSVRIASRLYENSKHPNIKQGELYVAYFANLLVDDEMTDALGIFKTETKDSFLTLDSQFHLSVETGTYTGKMDKGCIIFNTLKENGYKICNIDHVNKNNDALFWRDNFLKIEPLKDNYFQTKNYIKATQSFIRERMPQEFDSDVMDEASMLGRSMQYFKNNEAFDTFEYEAQVFKDDKVVEAFRDYKDEYQNLRSAPLDDVFEISEPAFRKQSSVFKSVIKLDKNFHIYVHGDREKITRGVDADGRKYYVLYYDDES